MRHAAIQPKPWMPFEGAASLGVVALGACVAAIAVALANQPYFDLVNRAIGARESVARGVLFSSWLVLLAVPIVARRPAAFGIGIGALRRDAGLVVAVCAAGAAVTFAILRLIGGTPYGSASLFIEALVVPVTEELLFRAAFLTILVAVLVRIRPGASPTVSAITINGLAFGLAHGANATSLAATFVLGQVVFATALGMVCAGLMLRTRSVLPAIALHGVVNAVVVIA